MKNSGKKLRRLGRAWVGRYKNALLYGVVVVVAVLVLVAAHNLTTDGGQIFGKYSTDTLVDQATVTEVLFDEIREYGRGSETTIHFTAEITRGERKGQEVRVLQVTDSHQVIPIKLVEAGDRAMICFTNYQAEKQWIFQSYDRSSPLFVLLIAFFGLLIAFGGKKGLGTILSLVLTCASVFYYFIPAILSGQNIYQATIFCCLYIVAVTLILVNGFNFKSLSAAVGCLGGLMVSGVLFGVMDYFLRLTGHVDEESAYLTMMSIPLDLKAIIFSSVLIGVLGGVLDVGVSIAAALAEIYPEGGDHKMGDIMASGMNIGRDILCTMTNTLILVYIGSAMSLTILLMVYSNSFFELINREVITVEILQALLGSMGLLFTIPLSTFFYGLGITRQKPPKVASDGELIREMTVAPILPREIPEALVGRKAKGSARGKLEEKETQEPLE